MLAALADSKYASRVEMGIYLAPHQPRDFKHPEGIFEAQFSKYSDWVSSNPKTLLGQLMQGFNGQSDLGEIEEENFLIFRPKHEGGKDGHDVDTWNNILTRISDFLNMGDDK